VGHAFRIRADASWTIAPTVGGTASVLVSAIAPTSSPPGTKAPPGMAEAARMVLPLGIAGDHRADDAGRQALDPENAGAGTVVGVDGRNDVEKHGWSLGIGRRAGNAPPSGGFR